MSFVIAAPEFVTAAASDMANIGATISAANAAAAPTTAVLAAAKDEVSAAIAALFSSHGQHFQGLSAQAAAFHAELVHGLSAAGAAYTVAEAGNVSLLVQGLQQQFFDQALYSPFIYLTGQPLFGKAAVGPAVTGSTGQGLAGALLRGFFNGTLGAGSGGVSQGTGTPGVVTRSGRGPPTWRFRSVPMATTPRRAGTSRRRQTARSMPAVSSICSTASWEPVAGTAVWPSP